MVKKFISLLSACMLLLILFIMAVPVSAQKASAQSYNCGTYGTSPYGAAETENTNCPSGNLEDTGRPVVLGILLGGGIIALGTAGVVLTRHRRHKPKRDS